LAVANYNLKLCRASTIVKSAANQQQSLSQKVCWLIRTG